MTQSYESLKSALILWTHTTDHESEFMCKESLKITLEVNWRCYPTQNQDSEAIIMAQVKEDWDGEK